MKFHTWEDFSCFSLVDLVDYGIYYISKTVHHQKYKKQSIEINIILTKS